MSKQTKTQALGAKHWQKAIDDVMPGYDADGNIVEQCQHCKTIWVWENDFAVYQTSYGENCRQVDLVPSGRKAKEMFQITQYLCDCGQTIAVFVNDTNGGGVYTPCLKPL